MSIRPPVFQEQGATYHADRCQPLVDAVDRGEVALRTFVRAGYPGRALPRGVLPGVLSVGYWDAVGRQDWGLDWHCNEGIEITFLETGAVPFAVGDAEYRLKPGDLTVMRPWQPHRVGNPRIGPGRLHWLILDVGIRRPHQTWQWPKWLVLTRDDMKRLTTMLSHNEQPVWRATQELVQCFQRIAGTVDREDPRTAVSHLTVYINEMLVLLTDLLTLRQAPLDSDLTSTRRTVEMFLAELRGNPELQAEALTLRGMADRCGLGVTHFGNLCKQLTNMTPIQYLSDCRVETAAGMLVAKPEASVTDIAFACGFSSCQYFATVFRQVRGCSPREWRKRKEKTEEC
ncbi:MAG: AraC family transcriptional regulator [bacterium]|nr:AraC family transcriptional regulator [bacterium]